MREIITFQWWNAENSQTCIPEHHMHDLRIHAVERANAMVAEGCNEGQLSAEIAGDEHEPDVEYTGWWKIRQQDMRGVAVRAWNEPGEDCFKLCIAFTDENGVDQGVETLGCYPERLLSKLPAGGFLGLTRDEANEKFNHVVYPDKCN